MLSTKEYIRLFRKYQRGEASLKEMDELLGGLRQDGPFCRWMDETWEQSHEDIDPTLRDRLYEQIASRISLKKVQNHPQPRKTALWPLLAKIAATLLVLVAVGFGYWHFSSYGQATPWTTIASHDKFLKVTLPDSSQVWLCRNSTLQYPEAFQTDSRTVRITGEAYFEVHHDRQRPFTVNSHRLRIRVTGTKFSISDYRRDSTCEVVLSEGAVNVSPQRAAQRHEVRLHSDYAYLLLSDGQEKVQHVDASALVAWKDGTYQFSDVPLGTVLRRLGRFYGKDISCDPSMSGRRISCTIFVNDSLEVVLRDLSRIVPISWKTDGNKCYVVGK